MPLTQGPLSSLHRDANGYHENNDSCITQCTFRLVAQFSLTLSLGHLSLRCVILQKGGQVTKSTKIVTLTKKYTVLPIAM